MSINHLFLITFLELVTAIIAAVLFKKYIASKEKYFLYFLWFTLIFEIIGAVMRYVFEWQTIGYYNFYILISFLFYYHWYYTIIQSKSIKNVVLIFSVLFLGVALYNLLFQSWFEYHQYTFIVGALLTLVCTIFHFWQLLHSDEILELKYKLSFWISTGLLLFNIGMVPFMLLSHHLNFKGNSYYLILITLNVILYGCYIIGFLWTKEKYNRF